MAVRLQTAAGMIKKYRTAYVIRGGLDDAEKYAANCEGELKDEPSPQEECDHLDCAIYSAAYIAQSK